MARKNFTARFALMAIALGACLSLSTAQARPGHHGRGHGGMMMKAPIEKLVEALDLTEEQASQIEAVREEARARHQETRAVMKAARKEMKALWKAETLDRGAILAQFEKMHALKGEKARARIETRLEIASILTAEQRAQAQALRKQHRGHRRGGPWGEAQPEMPPMDDGFDE
ncbi:MAG: Spy/CpxP family protein refolding chaperone [Bradymonadia bacterium]